MEGIWLGHARDSNEILIGTNQGVVRAYSVRRKPEEERWNAQRIQEMRGTPQQPVLGQAFDAPSPEEPTPTVEPRTDGRSGARRLRITPELLDDMGYTEGSKGCDFKRAGLGERRGHNETCRKRISEELQKTEDGRRRLKAEAERTEKVKGAEKELEREKPNEQGMQMDLNGHED